MGTLLQDVVPYRFKRTKLYMLCFIYYVTTLVILTRQKELYKEGTPDELDEEEKFLGVEWSEESTVLLNLRLLKFDPVAAVLPKDNRPSF